MTAALKAIYAAFLFGFALGAVVYAVGIEHGRTMEQPAANPPKVCQPSGQPRQPDKEPQEDETLADLFFSVHKSEG